jgi:uncharacterized protein (UPF0548 family)
MERKLEQNGVAQASFRAATMTFTTWHSFSDGGLGRSRGEQSTTWARLRPKQDVMIPEILIMRNRKRVVTSSKRCELQQRVFTYIIQRYTRSRYLPRRYSCDWM